MQSDRERPLRPVSSWRGHGSETSWDAAAASVRDGRQFRSYSAFAIIFWDSAQCIARVFIDTVADYLVFKAQVIAPQAMLIMECDRQFDLEQQRAKPRAA